MGESSLVGALEGMLDESEVRPFLESLLSSASSLDDNYSDTDLYLEAPKISMTRSVCRAFLAQAFLGNLALDPVQSLKPPDRAFYTGLNFDSMFWSDRNKRPVAVEKIKCLIQYFQATQEIEADKYKHHEVHFTRISVPDVSSLDWDRRIDAGRVSISLCAMERNEADAIVDFANEVFGVGRFYVESMTQEEIIQMCCPEMNVGMLFHGMIPNNQVCIVHNVGRYSRYKGYSSTFKFCGAQDPVYTQDILVIDASVNNKFSPKSIMRDILKAHTAFANASPKALHGGDNPILISTGKWGCGAFGGNVVHKFIQQAVAVSLCLDNRRLLYSAYGNQEELELLERVLGAIHGVRCQDILHVLEQANLFGDNAIKTDNYLKLLQSLEKLPHRASIE